MSTHKNSRDSCQGRVSSITSFFFILSATTTANAFAMHGTNRWGPQPFVPAHVPSDRYHTNLSGTRKEATVEATNGETASSSVEDGSSSAEEDDKASPKLKTADILSLESIRATLIRQEETIIFSLIERAQFRHNRIVYEKGAFGDLVAPGDGCDSGEPLSFLEYLFIGTERLHCGVRRYTSPEEHPFFPDRLPEEGPIDNLPALDFPPDLLSSIGGASGVNFNDILLKRYISEVVPAVSKRGDDEQHGSTVLADITALQVLSRRVHYGKFVAESKYRDNPEGYQKLVDEDDVEGVWSLLTNMEVEKKVLRRSRLKAATYGREPLLSNMPEMEGESATDATSIVAAAAAAAVIAAVEAMGEDKKKKMGKVDPSVIESIYRDVIIPLTKDIEVAYLFKRCGKEPPEHLSPSHASQLVQGI